MDELSTRIEVSNGRRRPWEVHVEPWGEDFTLLPDESLEVVAEGRGATPWFYVVENEGSTQVYCEETVAFAVYQEGRLLECGHNRGVQSLP
jgi:hypothetical protein